MIYSRREISNAPRVLLRHNGVQWRKSCRPRKDEICKPRALSCPMIAKRSLRRGFVLPRLESHLSRCDDSSATRRRRRLPCLTERYGRWEVGPLVYGMVRIRSEAGMAVGIILVVLVIAAVICVSTQGRPRKRRLSKTCASSCREAVETADWPQRCGQHVLAHPRPL